MYTYMHNIMRVFPESRRDGPIYNHLFFLVFKCFLTMILGIFVKVLAKIIIPMLWFWVHSK